MPLVNMGELLQKASAEKRGVGMFNVVGLEYAEAIANAADEAGQPVILGLPAPFLHWHKPRVITELMRSVANNASVPVAIHLDHGNDFDLVVEAIRVGFTSVMFDGSALPVEENKRLTTEIVKIAHAMDVSVEGELGYLGFEGEGVEIRSENLTDPQEAADFARATGVDALAVAIGNMHGHYKGTPHLELERLAAIRQSTPCALVLHGGSGLGNQDFQNAVQAGVSKINIFTNITDLTGRCVSAGLEKGEPWYQISKELTREVQALVKDIIEVFACGKTPGGKEAVL